MKIAILNDSKQSLGGGWTFLDNLRKGLLAIDKNIQFTSIADCDVAFAASSSMITKETVKTVQDLGKKFVLRLDNIPRNSRNRNTGTSRLESFARQSDLLIFQCKWAVEYLEPLMPKSVPRTIIFNGVDTEIFNEEGSRYDWGKEVFLYSRYNRDETKCWEKAWYKFQMIHREHPEAKLKIVGQFSPEQIEYNFDFFNGEDVEYLGVISSPQEMAKVMRSCQLMLATYYNDCYSNTYQEALACGLELYEPDMSGGTPELIMNGVLTKEDMAREYLAALKEVLST